MTSGGLSREEAKRHQTFKRTWRNWYWDVLPFRLALWLHGVVNAEW